MAIIHVAYGLVQNTRLTPDGSPSELADLTDDEIRKRLVEAIDHAEEFYDVENDRVRQNGRFRAVFVGGDAAILMFEDARRREAGRGLGWIAFARISERKARTYIRSGQWTLADLAEAAS